MWSNVCTELEHQRIFLCSLPNVSFCPHLNKFVCNRITKEIKSSTAESRTAG